MGRELKTFGFNWKYDLDNESYESVELGNNDEGYDYWVESIILNAYCADGLPIAIYFQIQELLGPAQSGYRQLYLQSGVPVVIPLNKILRCGRYEMKFGASTNPINNGRTIETTPLIVGRKFAALSNFDEEHVIYVMGDSIDVLSGYPERILGHRNYTMLMGLRESGYDCRLASMAFSGKSLNQFVEKFKEGYGLIRRASVILIQHGANDIGQNVSDSQWNLNLDYMDKWRNTHYKDAKLVIVKVPYTAMTSPDYIARNTRQDQINVLIDAFVASTPNTYTINCSTAVPIDGSYYSDGLHLNQLGHDAAGAELLAGMKTILGLS